MASKEYKCTGVRGCIALAVTARVRADACSHRLADAVKGGELSYMALALQREPTAYRSLLMRQGAVLADARADASSPGTRLHRPGLQAVTARVGVALSRSRPTVSHSIWYAHGTIREIGHDVVVVLYEYSTAGFLRNTAR